MANKALNFLSIGMEALNNSGPRPAKFPARHTLEASQAVARRHGLSVGQVVYAQQNPAVIDAGVFHNDVIAVGNRNAHFYHQEAFLNTAQMKQDLLTAWGDRASQFHLN